MGLSRMPSVKRAHMLSIYGVILHIISHTCSIRFRSEDYTGNGKTKKSIIQQVDYNACGR